MRLAAYRAAREKGVPVDRAASIAKNVTVNFNRRGTFGPAMNAAYLFYNASMQGSVRSLGVDARCSQVVNGVARSNFVSRLPTR